MGIKALSSLALIGSMTFSVFASVPDIPKLTESVSIDGKIDESVWQRAAQIQLNNITWPDENTTPNVKTTVSYFENGDTLFIAFKAQDPEPDNIRAFYNDRDRIWRDDLVGVKLDPYNDHRQVFQFFSNALGVQADSTENVVTNRESDAWDGLWDSSGQVTDTGFEVEMAIPLRNFNFNPKTGKQTWAIEFVRFYPRDERQRISNQQIDRNNDCWSCQMKEVVGFENLQQGKNLAIVPTLVLGQAETRSLPDDTSWQKTEDYEFGLDIKWGISSDVFLNATINPDFSQVEADSAQLGINNNFTLFFPEKRPFFLENQDIFSSNFNLVYTRNIGAPDIGAKVTGKTGKHTYGVFVTDDVNTTFLIPGNLSSGIAELGQDSNNTALRYRYDANNKLSVGILSTLRTSDDYHNYVASVDASYRITEQDEVRVQYMRSDTEYPEWLSNDFCDADDAADCERDDLNCSFNNCVVNERVLRTQVDDSLEDSAFRVRYEHEERDWFASATYMDIGSDFRADLGFMSRVDLSRIVIGGGLFFYGEEDDWYSRFRISGDWDITHNDAGEVIERELEARISVNGMLQSYTELGCIANEHVGNRIDASTLAIKGNTDMFNRDFCYLYGNFQPIAGLFVENEFLWGKQIDFRNNRLADRFMARPGFQYSFNKHLKAEVNYVYQTLEAEGQEVFTANQADIRLKYNFDVRNSLKLSIIYTDIEQNLANQPAVAPEDLPSAKFTDVSTQLIYSYKINPQTVFFAGYSDHAFEDDVVTDLEKDARSLFMKFSYAWLR
ncbi:MAG: hypothetical protein GJ680_19395 [Alteromonadaceae bacterium]|nr:hypothetical protein [Alteromonadaceae bacterium]